MTGESAASELLVQRVGRPYVIEAETEERSGDQYCVATLLWQMATA